jgi:hypothetical protein
MKSTHITVYSGLAYIDQEYIDIESGGSALDLSGYDLQMQILDADDDYAVLMAPTITKDSVTNGRAWPTFTAEQSTALIGKNVTWILLMRTSSPVGDPRLIGFGRVDVEQGATWQS